eukprot:TRINITY_DN3606_c0_g1_i1.p1 TRINITY_DN3606_c0_g1~~TRINITY_DN3606_c0_g1_i1.p1  ORF type:complete len:318 (+),score=69.42 TRINITY_DN3606_c0_g1_i1:422-1375(+)
MLFSPQKDSSDQKKSKKASRKSRFLKRIGTMRLMRALGALLKTVTRQARNFVSRKKQSCPNEAHYYQTEEAMSPLELLVGATLQGKPLCATPDPIRKYGFEVGLQCAEFLGRVCPLPRISAQGLCEINRQGTSSAFFAEVIELWQSEFSGPSEVPLPKFVDFVQKGIFRVFVLTQSDLPHGHQLSAFVVTSNYGQNEGEHIEYLAVNPVLRGKGVGQVLCRSIINLLTNESRRSQTPKKFISLECEPFLVPFYSKFGWKLADIEPARYKMEVKGKTEMHPYHFMTLPLRETNATTQLNISSKRFLEQFRAFLQNGAA